MPVGGVGVQASRLVIPLAPAAKKTETCCLRRFRSSTSGTLCTAAKTPRRLSDPARGSHSVLSLGRAGTANGEVNERIQRERTGGSKLLSVCRLHRVAITFSPYWYSTGTLQNWSCCQRRESICNSGGPAGGCRLPCQRDAQPPGSVSHGR